MKKKLDANDPSFDHFI